MNTHHDTYVINKGIKKLSSLFRDDVHARVSYEKHAVIPFTFDFPKDFLFFRCVIELIENRVSL